MSWPGKGKPQNAADAAAAAAKDSDGPKTRFAAPPPCPRCDLTKSQMTRTIQNYQKAYRKKVEGLKEELKTFRADNGHLRTQVRNLRRKKLVSPPSLLIGSAVGYLAGKYLGAVLQRLFRRGKGGKAAKAGQQGDEAAAAADGAQEALTEQQL